jgi:Ca2+-dependent lipid-binding protein
VRRRLTLHRAAGLKKADRKSSDPYCVLCLAGHEVGRTEVVKQSLEPEWGHDFDLVL